MQNMYYSLSLFALFEITSELPYKFTMGTYTENGSYLIISSETSPNAKFCKDISSYFSCDTSGYGIIF